MNTHTAQDTPFIPAPRITTVAGYRLTRLAEANYHAGAGLPVPVPAILHADDTPPLLRDLSRVLARW